MRRRSFGACFPATRIQIINDDAFDTTLEFDVVLEDAENCLLDPRGSKCAVTWRQQESLSDLPKQNLLGFARESEVMILDDDVFPSNTYREVLFFLKHPTAKNTSKPSQRLSLPARKNLRNPFG